MKKFRADVKSAFNAIWAIIMMRKHGSNAPGDVSLARNLDKARIRYDYQWSQP